MIGVITMYINFTVTCDKLKSSVLKLKTLNYNYTMGCKCLSDNKRRAVYLEVMFLMQLCKNIHDGHGPRVLWPENLQKSERHMD